MTTKNSVKPALSMFSIIRKTGGFPAMSSNGLGTALVIGINRVPRPAARMTAVLICIRAREAHRQEKPGPCCDHRSVTNHMQASKFLQRLQSIWKREDGTSIIT